MHRRLDVVFRLCDRVDVHPERGPRFIDVPKPVLIKKCFVSLLNSIKLAENLADISLTLVDDNSSNETREWVLNRVEASKLKVKLEVCKHIGYNYSALRQFELCRDAEDLVYSVEDDYLHFPKAISNMVVMNERFESITGSRVAIRPDDDLFTYSINSPHSRKESIILLGTDRHWRTLHCTHNTIFTHAEVFREHWELFASLAKFFKKTSINEDKSINMVWERVPLFSPIPTLAIHVSQNNEPPFIDYRSLWESIDIS